MGGSNALEDEDTKIAHIHCTTTMNDSFEGGEEKKSDSLHKKTFEHNNDPKYKPSISKFGTEKKKDDKMTGFEHHLAKAYYKAPGTTTNNKHDDDDDESSIPKSLQLFVQDIDESFIESKSAYWA